MAQKRSEDHGTQKSYDHTQGTEKQLVTPQYEKARKSPLKDRTKDFNLTHSNKPDWYKDD